MSRYIDADKFIEDQRKFYCEDCYMRKSTSTGEIVYDIGSAACGSCRLNDALNALEDTPSADVEEMRHGKWIVRQRREHYPSGKAYEEYVCPYCKRADHNGDGLYCGYCGAKMGGGKNEIC